MDCLTNFIGIRQSCTAGSPAPKSGLYIEDLPGMSVGSLGAIASGKHQSAIDMINEKVQFAGKLVMEEALNYINPHLEGIGVAEEAKLGSFSDTYSGTSVLERGILIRRKKTALSKLHIAYIYVRSGVDKVGMVVTITDGSKTTDFTFDAKAGEEVQIHADYFSDNNEIRITSIDPTWTPSEGSTANTTAYASCVSCGGKTYKFLTAHGYNDGTIGSKNYGIRVDANIQCDLNDGLCALSQRLKFPILYKTGIESLQEWLASDRMNWLALNGKKWAAEQLEYWRKVEYPNKFNTAAPGLSGFLMKYDGACFNCGGTKYGYVHP